MHLYTESRTFKFEGDQGYLDFAYGEDSVVSEIAPTSSIDFLINGILDPITYFVEQCMAISSKRNSHAIITGFTMISKEASRCHGNFIFILRIEFKA